MRIVCTGRRVDISVKNIANKVTRENTMIEKNIEMELAIYQAITEHYLAAIAAVSLVLVLGLVSLYLAGPPIKNEDNN